MEKLKLNQFHWQLADEKKWRIALKADSTLADKEQSYTPVQIKEIVKYAQDRFINITPEINLHRQLKTIQEIALRLLLMKFAPCSPDLTFTSAMV